MFDKLYEFLINFLKYFRFRKIKNIDNNEDEINEILLKYDEIYNIESPFIM